MTQSRYSRILRGLRLSSLVSGLLLVSLTACGRGAPIPRYQVADRGADQDGDGAADRDDACMTEPEDGLPPKANDGCPAEDADRDGIARQQDRCPDAKEDGAPPAVADGCPAADGDGDGVADALDRCATALEDNLDPLPSDGCPADDADGDGIRGVADRCPNQPEQHNGFRDEDGCPDVSPAAAAVIFDSQSAQIYVPPTMKINFDTGSSEIRPEERGTIARVATVLKARPDITRLEIEGHASAKGDEQANVQLTRQRAVAVARALVAQGIAAHRLVPVGYGAYCPAVVDHSEERDAPANRRVLFKAVVIAGQWQAVKRGCWTAQRHGIDPTKKRAGLPRAQPKPQPGVREAGGA